MFFFFYFGIWDIQEFWDMGYWNLFWDTSLIFGIWTVYFGIWDIAYPPNQALLLTKAFPFWTSLLSV